MTLQRSLSDSMEQPSLKDAHLSNAGIDLCAKPPLEISFALELT